MEDVLRVLAAAVLLLLPVSLASPMPAMPAMAAAPTPAVPEAMRRLQRSERSAAFGGPDDAELAELQWKTDALIDLVRADPWKDNVRPLLYFEMEPTRAAQAQDEDDGPMAQPGPGPNPDEDEEPELVVRKRSRYYRRYPWKRVTRTRGSYDPDLYMCTPSREDVIQLLVGLHRAREGDTGRTINFCNRKRPASSVFTNIRFIG